VTLLDSPALDHARETGTTPLRLVAAEIMKVRTTNTWRLFLLGFPVFAALALSLNGFSHHYQLYPQQTVSDRAQALVEAVQARTPAGEASITASMMTSGQFLGVLFAMLLGLLLMTNEVAHRTAAVTFLVVPRRSMVVRAKIAAAACLGALFWLISTAMDTLVTPMYLHSQHLRSDPVAWTTVRSVLLNLLAFGLWAVLGVGLGAVMRGQTASIVTGLAVYLGGFAATQLVFHLIYAIHHADWILGLPVIAPAIASNVMITPGRAFPHAPPEWVGLVVLGGYALVLASVGVVRTRRRDVA
jgi:hypothetical protein